MGTTLLGARTPANEIEQIYYLGVFDPQEQLEPMVYRVRVHGQASPISGMKFGSDGSVGEYEGSKTLNYELLEKSTASSPVSILRKILAKNALS